MTYRVVLIGDSHMEALAPNLGLLLVDQGMQVVHAETNRGKSTAWYVQSGKLGELVRQYQPDMVIVELGTNDQPNTDYTAMLRGAVEQIRSAGSPEIVWFGPSFATTSLATRLDTVRARQQATLPNAGVHWYDSWPMTREGHGPDGVHFTQAGYRGWASKMSDKIAMVPRQSLVLPLVALALAAVAAFLFAKAIR